MRGRGAWISRQSCTSRSNNRKALSRQFSPVKVIIALSTFVIAAVGSSTKLFENNKIQKDYATLLLIVYNIIFVGMAG